MRLLEIEGLKFFKNNFAFFQPDNPVNHPLTDLLDFFQFHAHGLPDPADKQRFIVGQIAVGIGQQAHFLNQLQRQLAVFYLFDLGNNFVITVDIDNFFEPIGRNIVNHRNLANKIPLVVV